MNDPQVVVAGTATTPFGRHPDGLSSRAATTVVEGACASGAIALRRGLVACRAGAARTVLCVGLTT